jgi:hypothetical protein
MSLFTTLAASKIAAGALAAGTLAVGGTAAAAYTGSLPEPLQQGAHSAIGAPAPSASSHAASPSPAPTAKPSETAAPVGPDATGPEAFGLCTAYSHGGLHSSSTAYASLEAAAKGAANIAAYCAKIPAPGQSADKKPDDSAEPNARAHGKDDASESSSLPAQATTGTSHRPANPGRP